MGSSPSSNQIQENHLPVSIKQGFFIFGQTTKGSIILKYQPNNITSYQSSIKLPKYANCFMGSGPYAYITGGVQQLQTTTTQLKNIQQQQYQGNISKKVYQIAVAKLFNPPKKKLNQQVNIQSPLDSAFKQLPDMLNARYSHCALENQGNIYVMGGRQYGDDQIGILAACQKYCQVQKKWKNIPTLRYPRSGAGAIFYGQTIYIFGGYTGKGERNRSIQSYKDGDKSWKQLPYRLHQGIQGFLTVAHPISPSTIYMFGGKTDSGKSNSVYQINFDKASVLHCTSMKEVRCFHKGFIFDKKVHIIGGGSQKIEIYDLLENQSVIEPELSFIDHCNSKQLSATSTLQPQIKLQGTKKQYKTPPYQKKLFIFGHARQPFSKIIDIQRLVVISEPQSLNHHFYKYQTIIRVNKQNCFVMGGLSSDHTKVTSVVYSLNLQTQQIKYLQPMKSAKYGFTAVVKGSYLYVVGGRKLGGDQVAILSSCQKFSFETYQWQSISSLKHKRHSALAVVIKNWLIVAGGYKGGGSRSNQIQMYVDDDNRWIQVQQKFDMAAESMTPITYKDQIYIFGGRVGDSDIQKVFKLHLTLNEGMKFQKSITVGVQAVGNLSSPGNNLRVYLDSQKGLVYVFGNVANGVDIYDLKKNKIIQSDKLPVFQHMLDPLFRSYAIVF